MKLTARLILIVFMVSTTMFGFQNCSGVSFESNETSLASLTAASLFQSLTSVQTKKNRAVDFEVKTSTKAGRLSLSKDADVQALDTANGRFEVTDQRMYLMKYTPKNSFVGVEEVPVFARDAYNNVLEGKVVATVGNSISHIQPALVVRGISCLACHANVSSNVVTDMGYGATAGDRASFFNFPNWNSSPLGDHEKLLNTINLSAGAKFIVPQAPIPSAYVEAMGAASLKDYITKSFSTSTYPSTRATAVTQVKSVSIKFPSPARLRSVFGSPAAKFVYERDTQNSPALSGLSYDASTGVFKFTDLTCDGDLLLDGTLLMHDAVVRSNNGCRIYVTGSVFADKNLRSIPASAGAAGAQHNIQIVSTTSISMGLGYMRKNGTHCEPTGWYQTGGNNQDDSLKVRFEHIVNYPNLFRQANSTDFSNAIKAEAAKVGMMEDASCTVADRNVPLNRILLAAPMVSSRFKGQVSGAIIAEFAMMSLSAFNFQFDPVFLNASVLPKLEENEILDIQL